MDVTDKFIIHDRVRNHTAPPVNERIDRLTMATLRELQGKGPEAIAARIAELDREWDIDRALMANFALLGGLTLQLGLRRSKAWLYLFQAQMAFLLMHATMGWCPPTPVFRRLGFRTSKEICAEKAALLMLLQRRGPAPSTEGTQIG
jgi:hypothetical protein